MPILMNPQIIRVADKGEPCEGRRSLLYRIGDEIPTTTSGDSIPTIFEIDLLGLNQHSFSALKGIYVRNGPRVDTGAVGGTNVNLRIYFDNNYNFAVANFQEAIRPIPCDKVNKVQVYVYAINGTPTTVRPDIALWLLNYDPGVVYQGTGGSGGPL